MVYELKCFRAYSSLNFLFKLHKIMQCDNQEPAKKITKNNAEALAQMGPAVDTIQKDLGLKKLVLRF